MHNQYKQQMPVAVLTPNIAQVNDACITCHVPGSFALQHSSCHTFLGHGAHCLQGLRCILPLVRTLWSWDTTSSKV